MIINNNINITFIQSEKNELITFDDSYVWNFGYKWHALTYLSIPFENLNYRPPEINIINNFSLLSFENPNLFLFYIDEFIFKDEYYVLIRLDECILI